MKKLLSLTILGLILSFGSFATITGTLTICAGGSGYLMDSSSVSGTWSSSNPAVATVGVGPSISTSLTAVSTGTATITYIYGTTTETQVVTVNPVPAAIVGGGTAICSGATLTLSDATSGGTWYSYAPAYATVGITTGVVTGVSSGVATIVYTVGGCTASTTVTVNVAPVDSSISGPSTVCAGSVITLSNSTSGGTWSSSSTATATVGAGTGIVTGVAAGAATITYSVTGTCGVSSAYKNITVTSTTSPGTISGASTVGVGSVITLTDGVTGGTWSSSATGIATVGASSGVVSGVAAGTTTISYAVSGCSGLAYATTVITVTPANIISGHVLFGGASYTGQVKVWLINYNSGTSMLTATDSTIVYSSGASAFYQFLGKPTDSFRVKAATIDSMVTYPSAGYTPTYHTSSAYWSAANVIAHVTATSDINEDINMNYGTVTSGIGFIGGNVTTGANKGTAGGVPAVGLMVYAINQSTGATVQYTYTDASGNYSFSNLPVGTMYKIYPELINYATTPYTSVNLTTASPSQSAANFVQHTISHTITPQPLAIVNVSGASYVATFPNPTNGKVTMEWNINTTEKATVAVMDVTGREVYNTTVDMAAGAGTAGLDLSNLNSGLYIITVKSASVNYNNKIQVQK